MTPCCNLWTTVLLREKPLHRTSKSTKPTNPGKLLNRKPSKGGDTSGKKDTSQESGWDETQVEKLQFRYLFGNLLN